MSPPLETLAHRMARLQPHIELVKPEGGGPFPVAILFHGCGGRRPMFDKWGAALARAGIAAAIVDSYGHRRISRPHALAMVCTGAQLRGRERAGDVYAAYAWTRAQAWAQPNRIVAAGWSHGAWSVMDGLALHTGAEMQSATGLLDLPDEPLEGLAAAFLVYPYAGVASLVGRRKWRIAPRCTAIVAGRDAIVGSTVPRRALQKQIGRGDAIEVLSFDANTHAFDDDGAIHPQVRFDPDATQRAQKLLVDLAASLP